MANRFYVLPVTTPAGTTAAAPQSTTWVLEFNQLVRIDVMTPAGHNGLTGIRFVRSTQQVIPRGNTIPLIANGETVPILIDEELTEGRLIVLTFNTDLYPHTHYLRATIADLNTIGPQGSTVPAVVPSVLLTSAGVLSP